jgi:ABC-type amino acid transport substrate-binding protein
MLTVREGCQAFRGRYGLVTTIDCRTLPAVTHLTVGVFSPSVLLRVARRSGELARHGLTVTETAVTSSPAQFRALLAGELDAVLTSPDNVVAYRFVQPNPLGRTADVRIVAGIDGGLGLALYAAAGVSSPDQLRARRLGVDVAASGFAFALFEILGRAGLRAALDYQVVELGSTPARLQALLAGRCDATMLNAGSDLRADEAGLVRLASVTDIVPAYLGTVLAVAGAPSPAVRALADALRATTGEVFSGRARALAVDEAAASGLSRYLAERYVDGLVDPVTGLVPGGTVDPAALAAVVDLRRRHAGTSRPGDDPLADATDPRRGLVDSSALL